MEYIIIILAVFTAGLGIALAYCIKRIDILFRTVSKLALGLTETEKRLEALENSLGELDIDDYRARDEIEKAWSKGLESIMNYGLDFPRLNKEGVKLE